MLYFAYGSNMNFEQMNERCPGGHVFLKRAFLRGYRFVYDGYSNYRKGAVANIVETREENDIVWGALFEINSECLSKLDSYEGYPYFYDRKEVIVQDDEGNQYRTIVYLRTGKDESNPSESYKNIIIRGAKDCGIPDEYIEKFLDK